MYYLGVDMAVEKHDLCLMGDDGRILSAVCIPNTSSGFEKLSRLLDNLDEIAINMERPDGLLVDWLSEQQYAIYVTPPLIVAHRRGRRSKDDRGDAYLLAHMLHTKGRECRPLPRQSKVVLNLGQLIKAYDDVVEQQRREVTRLTWTLRQYYPGAVAAFRARYSATFLAFLEAYPTPQAACALSVTELARFLKEHRAYSAQRGARPMRRSRHR